MGGGIVNLTYHENSAVSASAIADLRQAVGWSRIERYYSDPRMTSFLHIACYDNERLVGYVDSVSNGLTDAYIQDLVVSPEYQGKGIGTELMKRMIVALKNRGIFMISVIYGNAELSSFYKRFGFMEMLCGQRQMYEAE
jgi:ribosomal protein S18 acetylase RimI-like enzyme